MTSSGSDQFARGSLIVGDRAPDFEFAGPTDGPLRSCALLRQGPVLLTFHRGAWCTCCRADLRDLMSAMADLMRTRTTVLGVFHQLSPESGKSISREYGLSFPLVDDVNGRAAEAFGIRRSPSEMALIESELGLFTALNEGEPVDSADASPVCNRAQLCNRPERGCVRLHRTLRRRRRDSGTAASGLVPPRSRHLASYKLRLSRSLVIQSTAPSFAPARAQAPST
jgi:peroxiredoxin